ncbi:MAG: hypothetical protein ACF8LK_05330, partial [Phycisphaerales bacterium JB041]
MHDDIFSQDPTRLIDAADAVAEALTEVADAETGRCPYPPTLLDWPDRPACLDGFTAEELEEPRRLLK